MTRIKWSGILALFGLFAGCCSQPGVFQKLDRSLKTVQSYYEPLLQGNLQDEKVRRAVVAADTTLLLAGELQSQWCAAPRQVKQLELQVKETEELAREAGVTKGLETKSEGRP
ncbi:MAG: hypothetical protein AB1491_04770 [Thermodesulfobacteriota bacterium]